MELCGSHQHSTYTAMFDPALEGILSLSAPILLFFCNTLTTAEVLNLYLVSKDGGIGAASQIINNLSIDPADTFVLDTEKLVLENGDYLQATSANGNISATISIMNIS